MGRPYHKNMWERIKKAFGFELDLDKQTDSDVPEQFEDMSDKFLIAGLGNTGKQYRTTRHNVGFMAIDRLATMHGVKSRRIEHKAFVGKAVINGKAVILAKPQTMMNRSGDSVGPLAKFYQIPPDRVIILYDELDIDFGMIRMRPKGGAGGHNGMRSIIQRLGNDFPRVRIGIGRPPGRMPASAYVLQRFNDKELDFLEPILDDVARACEDFVAHGIDYAMNKHNPQRMKDEG